MLTGDHVRPLAWHGGVDGYLRLIDQTRLPGELIEIDCRSTEQVWLAIQRLRVRGAPAIGVAAGYGVVLAAGERIGEGVQALRHSALQAADYLATSRPTAVNLFWALDRMRRVIQSNQGDDGDDAQQLAQALLNEASAIENEDRQLCLEIGRRGAPLIAGATNVLTHCNAGALATSAWGTALAVIYHAVGAGQSLHVYADETRPLLQGARLSAWELKQNGVPVTVICDSMAAPLMRDGKVDAVIVGADRIAANGDTANKIGTYGLAVLAKHHRIPFYVAAPHSTFDLTLASGSEIPIETRGDHEITHVFGSQRIVPEGVPVFNPAFDVTPSELISAIITDRGVINPVDDTHVSQVVG